jgi:putative tributyrin esterase
MIISPINFFSNSLGFRSTVNIILPQRSPAEIKQSSQAKFRTLYLLHGYSDDHTAWQRWTSIERYVEGLNLAVVMPAVQLSFYTDMVHGGKYFTYITEELPALLHDIFPLSSDREDTFVAGLSMGGYGAFKLALSRPDLYSAAASLSGAVDICQEVTNIEIANDPPFLQSMLNIFGDLQSVVGSDNDLFALAKKTAASKEKPRLYQCCGTEDFLYKGNISFRDFIRSLPVDYTYEEGPGEHSWKFWDLYIQKVLDWLHLK